MPADAPAIRRRFADLAHGQVHYRTAGSSGPVLLLLHASPGSSRQLERMIASFAGTMRVIAPDTPGNGDSVALPGDTPAIADLARAMLELLDTLGIARAHVYGSHTGAAIAAELALLAPDRVATVMLDGLTDLTADQLDEMLARYAHPFAADDDGAYLTRVFQFCRDQYLFFPWYDHTAQASRAGGLPGADDLAALVLETLKARTTYHRNYHAAFRWPARERLPLLARPALLLASAADPLHAATQGLAAMAPGKRFTTLPRFDVPDFAERRRAALVQFMGLEN